MGLLALALLFTLSGCGWVFDLLAPTVNDESKEEIAEWFDTDWQYRKQLNISNPTGGTQMKLVVYQNDGHDNIAAGIMDCEGKCASDFSDLRFVGADDSTLCDYWIERQTADYAVVWIKSQGEDHLFVYYGNGEASDQSSGPNTFPAYFDHWDTDNTGQFETAINGNFKHWAHSSLHIDGGKRLYNVGQVKNYNYGQWDFTYCGLLQDSSTCYTNNDNYAAIVWWQKTDASDPAPDTTDMWVRLETKVSGSKTTGTFKSIGDKTAMLDVNLSLELCCTTDSVSFRIINLDTGALLAEDAFTNPAEVPDPATIGSPFFGGVDAGKEITISQTSSILTWANASGNGGMEFYTDYLFIGQYAGPNPDWSDLSTAQKL